LFSNLYFSIIINKNKKLKYWLNRFTIDSLFEQDDNGNFIIAIKNEIIEWCENI
jgi:hypothetical protein